MRIEERRRFEYAEAELSTFLDTVATLADHNYVDERYVEAKDRISALEYRINLIYQMLEEIKSMLSDNNVEVDGKELKDILSEYLEIV